MEPIGFPHHLMSPYPTYKASFLDLPDPASSAVIVPTHTLPPLPNQRPSQKVMIPNSLASWSLCHCIRLLVYEPLGTKPMAMSSRLLYSCLTLHGTLSLLSPFRRPPEGSRKSMMSPRLSGQLLGKRAKSL